MSGDKTIQVVLLHKEGGLTELSVDKDIIRRSGIVRRNGRFYTYGGPYQGNYQKIKFNEVSQPVELD